MKKKLIRLTESDLHNIIKNSVNKVLREICEIDDMKDQVMGSDWDLHDAEGMKYQQMQDDWEQSELTDRMDKFYYDQRMEDSYLDDFNRNINDHHSKKYDPSIYPF